MDEGFIDLALTPQEKEDRVIPVTSDDKDDPIYPFGTSISLENDQIEKLGLEDGEVGDYLHCEILVKLCGIHSTATESGERKCMNLQITHLKIVSNDDEDDDEEEEYGDRE